MFNTTKFGGYLSRLRKNADMTQSELADRLNLTRQAISRYETGDSFPDVSVLVLIADIFGITLDELINSGEPTRGEQQVLCNIAIGKNNVRVDNLSVYVGLAPLLKPSVLEKLSEGLFDQDIDISSVVTLAEYLSDESVVAMIEKADYRSVDAELMEKLMPFLDHPSREKVLEKIFDGEMDWRLLGSFIPVYGYGIISIIEAAVIDGALPDEALNLR